MTSVAVIGTGAVGVSTGVALMHTHAVRELCFYDANFEKAEGEALDLAHASSLFPACSVSARKLEDMLTADIVIVTAGVKSKPGETRLDLLERNLLTAKAIADRIDAVGLPQILIIVTNPVDVITEYFRRRFSQTKTQIFGSGTSLDSLRLRYEIAMHYGVGTGSVHAWVVGEHGDSSVSLLSLARLSAFSLQEYSQASGIPLPNIEELQMRVRTAAYRVIQRKGATSHAIGENVARLVKAIVNDEKIIVPLSVGYNADMCTSLPCLLSRSGPARLTMPALSTVEQEMFQKSVETLKLACEHIRGVASHGRS